VTHIRQDLAPTRDRGLVLIAGFKFVKAILLIALGIGAFQLLDADGAVWLRDFLEDLSLPSGLQLIQRAIDLVQHASRLRLGMLGSGAILYAVLFVAEGIGLWRGKRWAEYLTVFATGVLIPVEVYELARGVSPLKVLALAANVVAVAYLVYRLRHPSRLVQSRAW
jgi:uncharacterized membrane protein (DUF2068 family)